MSAYSLAHVVDVEGWPTVWGLEVEPILTLEDEDVEDQRELREEFANLTEELTSISTRLKRLQSLID